jgi:hypothetical protein
VVCGYARGPEVECVQLEEILTPVDELTKKRWIELKADDLIDLWPLDPERSPCGKTPCEWWEAWDAAQRLCESCGMWPHLGYDEVNGVGTGNLRNLSILLCPDDLLSAIGAAQLIVDAVGPPADAQLCGLKQWSLAPEHDSQFRAYRWEGVAGRVSLDIRLLREHNRWKALVHMYPCLSRKAELKVEFDEIEVAFLRVVEDEDMDDLLRLDYISRCHLHDGSCIEKEVQELWPLFRHEAESRERNRVHLTPVDCSGDSTFFIERQTDGSWSGVPFDLEAKDPDDL